MRRTTFIVWLTLLIGACTQPKQNKTAQLETSSTLQTKAYTTQSGKVFEVEVDTSMGASINKVKVITGKFENANDTFLLGAIDPLEKVFLADLDGNGFEELYLVTRSAGSGSYATLYGFASNRDKSVSAVYVQQVTEAQLEKGELFEGFRGHNTISLEDGKLVSEFPVYRESDTNANPSGGSKKVTYQLVAGEAGWQLVPGADGY